MQAKATYVVDLFRRLYNVPQACTINYGLDGTSTVQIKPGRVDYFQQPKTLDESRIIWKTWDDTRIPMLLDFKDDEFFEIQDSRAVVNFDLVASSFYFLSGWQEFTCPARDEFGRFPFSESLQRKHDFITIPVVNYYFDILRHAVETVTGEKLKPALDFDGDFAVCLSHDIDECMTGWLEGGASELKQGRLLSVLKLLARRLQGKDVWYNFDEILAFEKQYETPSSFYFLCNYSKDNADYDIRDSRFSEVYQRILEHGSEIGLHGSLGTHDDLDKLLAELQRLNHKAVGHRFHYLKYEVSTTPKVLQEVGFGYDTTLGFSEHFGFRNGFCFPFQLYDVLADRPLDVVEIPLVLMDATLRSPAYLGLNPQDVLPRVIPAIQEAKRFGGCFTVLWHNNYFSEFKFSGWRQALTQIMDYCHAEKAAFISGAQLFDVFQKTMIGK